MLQRFDAMTSGPVTISCRLASAFGVRFRIGRLPDGLSFRHVFGAGCVAGIGFTVSLFVADLSFGGAMLSEAKTGILTASVVSATAGSAWLLTTRSSTLGAHPIPVDSTSDE